MIGDEASMTAASTHDETLALVHEGWNHLMSQRPLAAWGTWQRAIRLDADAAAARQALETLEAAPDLPLAARKVYRFRKPATEAQRARWDRVLRNGEAAELAAAAEAFGRLAAEVPDDAEAWFNRALCLAWVGLDHQAIECLDQVTGLEAESDAKKAVEAWTLAEILRQAGGAESLSDDLRFACTFAWSPEQTAALRTSFPEIRQIPTPRDPTRPEAPPGDLEVLEWLDRPFPAVDAVHGEGDLPRVLATVYVTPGAIRLSSPRVETLELAEEKLRRMLGAAAQPLERVAAPLPLPFLDADVWTTRIPEELDHDLTHRLTREALESYYENQWIHSPRQGLDGLSPLAASQDARRGDAVARAKLEAVVQVREQLGSRSSAIAMYQGYPFDRLRRRLGLDLVHPDTVDNQDHSCASLAELQAQNAQDLDDVRLVDAFKSAAGLRDDELTTRFASELLRRKPDQLAHLDLSAVYAPLIRQSMQREKPQEALDWLEQARTLGPDSSRRTFDTWRAEIVSRTGLPEEASRLYDEILTASGSSPQVALDAAETLLDNGHFKQAREFLDRALKLARSARIQWVEDLASQHMKNLSGKRE
jgi:tetratricopeptide (TPR) repeat protein